jgi:hypothetical protein
MKSLRTISLTGSLSLSTFFFFFENQTPIPWRYIFVFFFGGGAVVTDILLFAKPTGPFVMVGVGWLNMKWLLLEERHLFIKKLFVFDDLNHFSFNIIQSCSISFRPQFGANDKLTNDQVLI